MQIINNINNACVLKGESALYAKVRMYFVNMVINSILQIFNIFDKNTQCAPIRVTCKSTQYALKVLIINIINAYMVRTYKKYSYERI